MRKKEGYSNVNNNNAAVRIESCQCSLAKILSTVDLDARAKLYGELQTYMRENPPFVYLYFPQAFEGVNKRVENYKPRAAENYFLTEISVSDGK